MGSIRTLDIQTANSIAAGEVVERPASVVKELCENAMDAMATSIAVEIRNGGISYIRVSDNGRGMDNEDALAAFGRHATSKLRTVSDLDSIGTMGFRGEALASIAAVSRVTLRTRQAGTTNGTLVRMEGGRLDAHTPAGCPEGTTVEVEGLFYNTPARFKFLKKDATESGYVGDVVERLALSRPDISFRFEANGQEILRTPGNNDLMSAVYTVFGKAAAQQCLPVSHRQESLLVSGFSGTPESARNNRSRQIFHVNGRTVQSRVFSAAVDEAYRNRMMKGKHPFVLLRLEIPPNLVDVNVHPQKTEVRFWNDGDVFRALLHAMRSTLEQQQGIPADSSPSGEEPSVPVRPAPREPVSLDELLPQTVELPQDVEAEEPDVSGYDEDHRVSPESGRRPSDPADAVHGGTAVSGTPAAPPSVSVVSEPADGSYPSERPAQFPVAARYIGSVFGTYLMLEDGDDLIVLDQHAAHERILYERLLGRARDGEVPAQPLLVPAVLEITTREARLLESEREWIEAAGFRFDAFGSHEVAIRAIPGNEREIVPAPALRAVLDDLLEEHGTVRKDAREAVLASIACKAAVKAGDRLDEISVRALLSDLAALENPYQCPHGRPTIFRITRKDLEKRFRRIV